MSIGVVKIVAAGIIVNASKTKVLLIRRRDSMWGNAWSIPGGHVEFGESIKDALLRELDEELKLKIESTRFLHFEEFMHPKKKNTKFISFNFIVTAGRHFKANREISKARWFSLSELHEINHKLPEEGMRYLRTNGVKR
jgi:8-oxo-dGTP diphosphatase